MPGEQAESRGWLATSRVVKISVAETMLCEAGYVGTSSNDLEHAIIHELDRRSVVKGVGRGK